MDNWLKHHHKTINDIPEILAQAAADDAAAAPAPAVDPRDAGASTWEEVFRVDPTIAPLDLIRGHWQEYMFFQSSHEYVVASCWTVHCFVYDRFMVTPRLPFISPLEDTGKTTALDLICKLTPKAKKSDDISPAALRWYLARGNTMALDEVDNMPLVSQRALLSAINANRRGSSYDRMGRGGPSAQEGYAPMSLACIGPLPRPQMSRSIPFYLVRASAERAATLKRFDLSDLEGMAALDRTYQITLAWLQSVQINTDPVMPPGFHGRRLYPDLGSLDARGDDPLRARLSGQAHPRAVARTHPRCLRCAQFRHAARRPGCV
jgi:hypothetical protein